MKNMLASSKLLLLACILTSSSFCFSQVTQQWVNRQNGDPNSPDVANDLVVDHNGNVYVTGWSQGKGTNTDFTTIKYDYNSNTKWVKRFNGPGNGEDRPTAIAIDHYGNVYVTGQTTGNGTGSDFTTIKYDNDGNTKWVKRYNGPGNGSDQAVAIAVDDDGNVYVTGSSSGSGTFADYATIKYDKDGNTKWVKRYNGPGNSFDAPAAVAVDNNGNVYVTGSSNGIGTLSDYATIKYNAAGDQQWVSRYSGSGNGFDNANALAVDHNGNVYVTGFITTFINSEGTDSADIATIKYNVAGTQLWASIYNRAGRDQGNALALDAAGNVYVTGLSGTAEEDPDNDYVTLKYNTTGMQQWEAIYAGPGSEQGAGANAIVLDEAGNVYVTGAISIETELDYATIRYNNNGVQQWVATYDGPGNDRDIAQAIGIDGNGNVYVTGGSRINQDDYATIRYNTAGVQKWVKRYNGPGDLNKGQPDMANAIAVDGDGNVHVTGGIIKNELGSDYTTYKYDDDGSREWKKTYNGPGIGPDEASAIALDAQGNVYVTGSSDGHGTRLDYATIKYGKDGDTKWVRRYNGPGNGTDMANAIAIDNIGNVYVTGTSVGGDVIGDYATVKYDNNGNLLWVKRYNGPGNFADRAVAIAVDAAGNVYVTGESWGIGNYQDYATIKYDAGGNELWVARYNRGPLVSDGASALAVDASGNVYVTGRSSAGEFIPGDYVTIKYNAAGVQQWVAIYNGPGNFTDVPGDIAVDASGNVYVTGGSTGSGTEDDYATIKYNTAGVQQWAARYNGPAGADDNATALTLDMDGNVYVTGGSTGTGSFQDYATVKYDAAGVQQWVARYNGPGNNSDISTDIAVSANGNVYVTGNSVGIGTAFDYATIKYEQTLNNIITRQETGPDASVADRAAGLQSLNVKSFPNAFSEFTNLQWSGSDKPVSIYITDIMGKLVERKTGLTSSGTLRTGSHFSAGVYYAVIIQGPEKVTLKLIKR
jgi:uncharacterized delta-60 repeat protein